MTDGEKQAEATETEQPKPAKKTLKIETIKCFPEVKKMLASGNSILSIVRFIQDECGEYTDVHPETVRANIYYYLNRAPEIVKAGRLPSRYRSMLDEIDDHIDPLDAVNMLFAVHTDRIMIEYEQERKKEKINPNNTSAMKLANEMLKTMSHLMLDQYRFRAYQNNDSKSSGNNDTFQQMQKVKNQLSERYGERAAAVAIDPESRRRVFNALQRVRKGDTAPMLKLLKMNQQTADEHVGKKQDAE